MLDIFEHNAFTVGRMSAAVREMKFKPGRIAELGLFTPESIDTTIAMFEKKGDLLVLVPPTPRGGPGTTMEKEKRDLRAIPVPHFELDDAVYADEVQNVRAFGQEQALETVVAKVAQRQQTMVNSFAVTEEHARMGAVTGVVTYSDGSTLDLFNTFGVTQEAELNFDLANKTAGALRTYTQVVRRQVLDLLGGVGVTGLRAFCGDNFFDALIANEEVRATYLQTQAAAELRAGYDNLGSQNIYGAFKFGDMVFENYRGSVGSTSFIDTDSIHIFPEGVPGLFRTIYAPADYEETVNTMGQRLYSRQWKMENGKGRKLEVQTNALQICVRPKVLLKGKRA